MDLLKNIREITEVMEKSSEIKSIRKTKAGNLILKLKNGIKAEDMEKTIQSKMKDAKIRTSGSKPGITVLEIINMASVTTNEITKALEGKLGDVPKIGIDIR